MLEIVVGNMRAPRRAVIVADTPGSSSAKAAQALTACAVSCTRRVFSPPPHTATSEAIRRWHRDLWTAIPPSERRRVLLVTGETAQYLAPRLGDEARVIAFVGDAIESALGLGLKIRRIKYLEEAAETQRFRPISSLVNAQSRALLGPWHDTRGFPVSEGPPPDADEWREALFGDVVPRLDALPAERAREEAGKIARDLKWLDKQVARYLDGPAPALGRKLSEPTRQQIAAFSWLDQELRSAVENGAPSQPESP